MLTLSARSFVLGTLAIGAVALVRCTAGPCPVSEAPCTSAIAAFISSCGFESFTTTCNPTASCGANACSIPIKGAQTCDATIVLGDGTTHAAHLVVAEPPPMEAGRCPATCPAQPLLNLMVDGVDAGTGITDFSSATCVASDAGLEASADAASDGATE